MAALSGLRSPLMGHNGGPPMPVPSNNQIALWGDSRSQFQSGSFPATTSNNADSALLYAIGVGGYRCVWADGGNLGIAGQTLTQIQARTASMIACPAQTIVFLAGVNDAQTDLATVDALLYEQCFDAMQKNKDAFIVLNEYPHSGLTGADLTAQLKRHNYLSAQLRQRYSKAIVVDSFNTLWDQTTPCDYKAGYAVDVLHLDTPGSRALGQTLGRTLGELFARYPTFMKLPTNANQVYNATTNPLGYLLNNFMLTGSVASSGTNIGAGSVLPTDWTLNASSSGGVVVTSSVTVNSDGFPELVLTLSGTATAAGNIILFLSNSAAAVYAAGVNDGDRVFSLCRLKVDAGATNFTGPGIYIAPTGGTPCYNFRGNTGSLWTPGTPTDDKLFSPFALIPAGYTAGTLGTKRVIPQLNLAVQTGPVAATIRVSQFGVLKSPY